MRWGYTPAAEMQNDVLIDRKPGGIKTGQPNQEKGGQKVEEELTDAERAVLRHIAHRELVMDIALIILLAASVVTVIAVIVEVL